MDKLNIVDETLNLGDEALRALELGKKPLSALQEAWLKAAAGSRLHVTGLPAGSLAFALAHAFVPSAAPRCLLVVEANETSARQCAHDLRFFCHWQETRTGQALRRSEAEGPQNKRAHVKGTQRRADVVHISGFESTPFAAVMQDRLLRMKRLSQLHRLARRYDRTQSPPAPQTPGKARNANAGDPGAGDLDAGGVTFVVVAADALARTFPSPQSLLQRSLAVHPLMEIEREHLCEALVHAGYVRVPVAEDPGTFAVRGGLVDIFAPSHAEPVRIELEDGLIATMRAFDPDTQRSTGELPHLLVPPVHDFWLNDKVLEEAGRRTRTQCDALNLPTATARAITEDLRSGRVQAFSDIFLPALYPELPTLFDYLPDDAHVIWADGEGCDRAIDAALNESNRDYERRCSAGEFRFPLAQYVLGRDAIADKLGKRAVTVTHAIAVSGANDTAQDDSLSCVLMPGRDQVLAMGAMPNDTLQSALRQRRMQRGGGGESLLALAEHITAWRREGWQATLTAHTQTQTLRLADLLRGYGVKAVLDQGVEEARDRRARDSAREGSNEGDTSADTVVRVCRGELTRGFVFPIEGIVFVTEEEIFGARSHRQNKKKRQKAKVSDSLVQDLRALEPGDYVVHTGHGIGLYLGIEYKALGQSQLDRLEGKPPPSVEVLVIEYVGGKLYVPVTRLSQIQKFAGKDGAQPKLDKLGGQSFAKAKAKVRKEVRQIADQLLRIYAERHARKRPGLDATDRSYAEFEAMFPFEETPDQAAAIADVLEDLESPSPMDRLVCGDVGFGKTEVAIRAAFRVASAGRQVAILCPTTVLAQQHYQTFLTRFQEYALRVEQLSRFVDRAAQSQTLQALKEGHVDVVVGTHRLLSKDVHMPKLGLLVVDEEQRFGVTHKERIKEMRASVDVLTLSATPIPRTMQMAVGGLRDLSLIRTAPVDRRSVRTLVCRFDEGLIKDAIERELDRGGQVFFVYNRIEGLYERAAILQRLVPKARIAVAHGQMGERALETIMTEFVEGQYDILCATAIIESGLDIPRANTMIVDRADTFGLAQLYQLRGRVGRSKERAFCYLVAPPLNRLSDESRARLEALERFSSLGSGFHIATLDMEMRGAGDLLGAEQSGSVTSVGIDMFVQMLEEAVAALRGESVVETIDTDIHLDLPHHIPDDYIDDTGVRLSMYKRIVSARDALAVQDAAAEMEDRFGPLPDSVRHLCQAMELKPALRSMRVLGCDASVRRVVFHLEQNTPLRPERAMALIADSKGRWSLSPDMKLSCHPEASTPVRGVVEDTTVAGKTTLGTLDGRVWGVGDTIGNLRHALAVLESLR